MNRLRAWFLAPTWAVMLTLFARAARHHPGLQPADARDIRRHFAALDRSRAISGWSIPSISAILWRSFWIAGAATALCLVLGFPLALFISRAGKRKNLYLSLVMLPFWTSFLVRTYAWMFLLRDTGLINTAAPEARPDSRSAAAAL